MSESTRWDFFLPLFARWILECSVLAPLERPVSKSGFLSLTHRLKTPSLYITSQKLGWLLQCTLVPYRLSISPLLFVAGGKAGVASYRGLQPIIFRFELVVVVVSSCHFLDSLCLALFHQCSFTSKEWCPGFFPLELLGTRNAFPTEKSRHTRCLSCMVVRYHRSSWRGWCDWKPGILEKACASFNPDEGDARRQRVPFVKICSPALAEQPFPDMICLLQKTTATYAATPLHAINRFATFGQLRDNGIRENVRSSHIIRKCINTKKASNCPSPCLTSSFAFNLPRCWGSQFHLPVHTDLNPCELGNLVLDVSFDSVLKPRGIGLREFGDEIAPIRMNSPFLLKLPFMFVLFTRSFFQQSQPWCN